MADKSENTKGYSYHPNWEYGSLAEPNQHIVHTMKKLTVPLARDAPRREQKRLAVLAIDCESIAGPCIGFRDPRDDVTVDTDYYFLKGMGDWAQRFYDEAQIYAKANAGRAVDATAISGGDGVMVDGSHSTDSSEESAESGEGAEGPVVVRGNNEDEVSSNSFVTTGPHSSRNCSSAIPR